MWNTVKNGVEDQVSAFDIGKLSQYFVCATDKVFRIILEMLSTTQLQGQQKRYLFRE